MKTTSIGQDAEKAVARYLEQDSYKVLARNWKTKVCEIDIIARKDKIIYFVEVKHRSDSGQGTGFEYIGPQKLNRLKFAARIWNQQNRWDGDYRILGAEVSGLNFEHIKLVEID